MSEFLERVTAKLTAPEALAHRVALYLSSSERRALITEADDDKFFYGALIKKLQPRANVEIFAAYGRTKVVSALRVLANLGKAHTSYGIIDRDFDFFECETILNDRCLVLNVYSYENLFMDHASLVDIGRYFFGLEAATDDLADWSQRTAEFIQSLSGCLLDEHVLAYCCKSENWTCHLNNFNVRQSLSVLPTGAIAREADCAARFARETSIDLAMIAPAQKVEAERVLNAQALPRYFRGHFFWDLVTELLNRFRLDLDNRLRLLGRNRSRTRQTISQKHALEGAAPFVAVPPYLETFLSRVTSVA